MKTNIFLKTIRQNGEVKKLWYYFTYDPLTKKQIQKRCKGCVTREEAEMYISDLPGVSRSTQIKVIAQKMYKQDSFHVRRRDQMGKSIKKNTMSENRRFLEYFISVFGHKHITELQAYEVMNYLVSLDKSASWKNQFLTVVKELYTEANWNGVNVMCPSFPAFRRKSKKSDVFSDEEILKICDYRNYEKYEHYILFLLTLSAGLRLSETRGFLGRQLLKDFQGVFVDGFYDRENRVRNNYCKAGSEENPKWRLALVPDFAYRIIKDYFESHHIRENELAFTHNDLPYRSEHLHNIFKRFLKRANIDNSKRKMTIHSLRYTYVTKMRSSLNKDIVQKMAGHTTAAMTDYYTNPSLVESKRALASSVDSVNSFFALS